jgi:hypothetical protein
METPMMKLKVWAEDNKRYSFEAGIQPDVIICKIQDLLEEEKKNIVDAFKAGVGEGIADGRGHGAEFETPEDYYTQTFKS